MKRKKPPVALISTLVGSVIVLVIASGAWQFYNLSPEAQLEQLKKQEIDRMRASQAGQAPDNSKVDVKKEVNALEDKLKKTQASATKKPMTDSEDGHQLSSVPTIVMPEETITKPVPNPAATSSQWYDNHK